MSREYPTVNESIAYDDGFKDAEDYWVPRTEERIIKLLEEHKDGDLLFAQNLNTPSEDVAYTMFKGDVIAVIKREQADHLGEAIRATAWAYTKGEQPNPLIKGENK